MQSDHVKIMPDPVVSSEIYRVSSGIAQVGLGQTHAWDSAKNLIVESKTNYYLQKWIMPGKTTTPQF